MKNKEIVLDNLWRDKIFFIFDGRCGMCGCNNMVSAHHIIKRRFRSTRWYLKNGILLCQHHHALVESNPKFMIQWLNDRFGEHYYDDLKRMGNNAFHGEYEYWKDHLKGE